MLDVMPFIDLEYVFSIVSGLMTSSCVLGNGIPMIRSRDALPLNYRTES